MKYGIHQLTLHNHYGTSPTEVILMHRDLQERRSLHRLGVVSSTYATSGAYQPCTALCSEGSWLPLAVLGRLLRKPARLPAVFTLYTSYLDIEGAVNCYKVRG